MAFVQRSGASLFVVALLGSALAYPEISRRGEADILLQKRAICYDDDTLLSFKYWRVDAEPYCSSLLNINDLTSTLQPATSRTTINGSTERTEAAATVTSGASTMTVTETLGAQGNYYAYDVYSQPSSVLSSDVAGGISSDSLSPSVTASSVPPVTATSVLSVSSDTTGGLLLGSFVSSFTALNLSTASTSLIDSYSTGTGSGPRGGASTTSAPYTATLSVATLPSYIPSLIPTSTTSSSLPVDTTIGDSIDPEGCPGLNNTIWTNTYGKQYQLQCFRFYGGPISIGLDQPHFRECIEQCSLVNAGFSAVRCYGVTWLKYGDGIHCNLKSQTALREYTTNYEAVSAVLLTGVPPPVVGLFRGAGPSSGNLGGKLPDDHSGTWRRAKLPRWLGQSLRRLVG
ncbi:MAG: hypothetical protein Q9226_000720 [Calogaya cf. arnoldii]